MEKTDSKFLENERRIVQNVIMINIHPIWAL